MRKTVVMSIFIMLTINTIYAQINGVVKDITGVPVVAANVFWLNTTNGTTTDAGGNFSIAKPSDNDKLVVSCIGYENDTLLVKDNSKDLAVTLKCGVLMREVHVVERKMGVVKSRSSVLNQDRSEEHTSELQSPDHL